MGKATATDAVLDRYGFKIIDAAYDWAMRDRGWMAVKDHWTNSNYELTRPDRQGHGSVMTGPDGRVVKHGADEATKNVFLPINGAVRAAFQPWFGLPVPGRLDGAYAMAARSAEEFWEAIHRVDGEYAGAGKAQTLVNSVTTGLGGFKGDAVRTFRREYASNLPSATQSFLALTGLLALSVRAEQKILETAHRDLRAIAVRCAAAMKQQGSKSDPDLEILGLALDVVGLIPAAGTVTSAAKVALDVFDKVDPPSKKVDVGPFDGDTAEEVIGQLGKALHALSLGIGNRENAMASKLGSAFRLASELDLKHARDLVGATSIEALGFDTTPRDDELDDHDAFEIKLDLEALHDIAADMSKLGGLFSTSAEPLAAGTDRDPWVRNGRIGIGDDGLYDEWQRLARRTARLMREMGMEMDAAGDHLRITTHLLQTSEKQTEHQLLRHKHDLAGRLD